MTLGHQRLLVGLDGTPWCDGLLTLVEQWTPKESHITLLHVVEEGGPKRVHGAYHLHDAVEAQRYLTQRVQRLRDRGLNAHWIMRTARRETVSETIARIAIEGDHDLVLLATHGRIDPRRWIRGSIAQHVLTHSQIDVLQLTPRFTGTELTEGPRFILIPLDGHQEHEIAIRHCLERIATTGLRVCLAYVQSAHKDYLEVIRGQLTPYTSNWIREQHLQAYHNYLYRIAQRMMDTGIHVTVHLGQGDPADELSKLVRDQEIDLVLMATHGRHGFSLFERERLPGLLVERIKVPLLMVAAAKGKKQATRWTSRLAS